MNVARSPRGWTARAGSAVVAERTLLVREIAADAVTLRDGRGVEHSIAKSTIEERTKLLTSIMPEGSVADLTIAEFASLLDPIEAIGK